MSVSQLVTIPEWTVLDGSGP